MTQGPVTNISKHVNLGPMNVYIGAYRASLSAAQSATDWFKLGLTKSGVQVSNEIVQLLIKSGFPLRPVKNFVTDSKLSVSGELIEFSAVNFGRVLGGPTQTIALKASPSTTTATGATKTAVKVAAVTNFNVNDEIAVVGASQTQYGTIQSINTSTKVLTLYEALSGDTDPTLGDTVKRVDTRTVSMGVISSPEDVGLKLTKTLEKGTLSIYVFKANAAGTFSMNFGDGEGNIDTIGLNFNYEALADSSVESGALASAVWAPND